MKTAIVLQTKMSISNATSAQEYGEQGRTPIRPRQGRVRLAKRATLPRGTRCAAHYRNGRFAKATPGCSPDALLPRRGCAVGKDDHQKRHSAKPVASDA